MKINKLKNYVALFAMMAFSLVASAQTVSWSMQPSDKYSEITRIGKNLYKVVSGGKIGLITAKGEVLAAPENDVLTEFYEGKALLTRSEKGGNRIVGCVTAEGRFNKFSDTYYELKGLAFYSDGLLAVTNGKNKGYVDANGNKAFPFSFKNSENILPFTEGFASVYNKENKKHYLIDKDGNKVSVKFDGGIGEAYYYGTNVYENIFYVYVPERKSTKYYVCDISGYDGGDIILKKTKKAPKSNSLDYLGRFSDITGKGKNVPFESPKNGSIGLNAANKGGVFGYEKGKAVVLPCQLQQAGNFEDGYAIVKMNGKLGILEYIEGQAFKINATGVVIEYKEGKAVDCEFILSSPSVWNGKAKVQVKDAAGKSVAVNGNSFSVTPSSATQKFMFTVVDNGGLKLYEKDVEYSFKKAAPPKPVVEKCKYCGKSINECSWHGAEH